MQILIAAICKLPTPYTRIKKRNHLNMDVMYFTEKIERQLSSDSMIPGWQSVENTQHSKVWQEIAACNHPMEAIVACINCCLHRMLLALIVARTGFFMQVLN